MCMIEAHKFLNPYSEQLEYVIATLRVVDNADELTTLHPSVRLQPWVPPENPYPPASNIMGMVAGEALNNDPWLASNGAHPAMASGHPQAGLADTGFALDDNWNLRHQWRAGGSGGYVTP